jgi:hypothetical protein
LILYLNTLNIEPKTLRNQKYFWQSSIYKINIHKWVAFLCTNNEQVRKKSGNQSHLQYPKNTLE